MGRRPLPRPIAVLESDYARIPLNKGYWALVDVADIELVCQYKWRAWVQRGTNHVYAVATIHRNGKPQTLRMHRLIFGAPDGVLVAPLDNNGLNCRRYNLCSAKQRRDWHHGRASRNPNRSSKFKGVTKSPEGTFYARVRVNGREVSLPKRKDEVDAAMDYDIAARKYYGDNARTNEDIGLLPRWISEEEDTATSLAKS